MNWAKSEAFWAGKGDFESLPQLPGDLKWDKEELKLLGVFLGSIDYKKLNWEGMLEKVRSKLSKGKWLLPQFSYRGRILVINNLVASTLWHKTTVLQPPNGLIEEIQRKRVTFFWSGQHWICAAALYLTCQEGGQGLIDIRTRIMAFRLQAAQRLLYHRDVSWLNTPSALLRRVRNMGLDKLLFLMELLNDARVNLTSF